MNDLAAAADADAARPPRGTILVIDDCATVRFRIREILEGADYRVLTAADGAAGLEEARRETPDAILVDFVMPRMNGFQFCRAARDDPRLRAVPVVLMSVKADRIGEQFVRHGLADDALSKPFQPPALLAVLAHRAGRAAVREETPEGTAPADAAPPPAAGPQEEEAAARAKAARAVEEAQGFLLQRVLPGLCERLGLEGPAADRARDALLAAAGETTLRELAPLLGALDPQAGIPSFSGSIRALPIGEVFQMVALQNLTGVMEIEGPALKARVFLSAGKIDLSRLDGQGSFRLGNYLVKEDLVSPQEVERIVPSLAPGEPIGERLIKLGLIAREDLHRALQRQATDIFYEVLRWPSGVYRFVPHVRPAEASSAALALPLAGLLMEGYRRVDEWRLIEREIRGFDEVYEPNPVTLARLDPDALSTEEKLVFDQVNGVRTVSQVVDSLRMDGFETCRILYRLLSLKVIHRRREPSPGSRQEDPFAGLPVA